MGVIIDNVLISALEHETTRDYFITALTSGNSLARELLQKLDFEGGHFFSIISNSADVSKINYLESGGILPQEPLEEIEIAGKKYLKQKKATSALELSKFLRLSLNNDAKQLCIFEEVAFEKGDKCISRLGPYIKYYEKEIYYFLSHEDCTESNLYSLIKQADGQWYYMNIITSSELVFKNDKLSIEDISSLALNTTHLILGAYGMEGYVCLQTSKPFNMGV